MTRTSLTYLLSLIAFITLTTLTISVVGEGSELEYGVMIDAGSSGTRTFLYSWERRSIAADSSELSPLSHPVTQEGWSVKSHIPLASFGPNPQDVGTLLQQTVDFARQKLTVLGVSNFTKIPIFLGATAGVRLMPYDQRVNLFKSVRAFYSDKTKSPFEFSDHFAKSLSGEEEGFFGWVAINYLTNSILPKQKNPIYGALDMGGASTQITFDTDGADLLENYYEYSTPDESRYGLYTTSFLKFGLDQWWHRYNDLITDKLPKGQAVASQCVHPGFKYTWKNSVSKDEFEITGISTGNWDGCYEKNKELLQLDTPCLTDLCSINGRYQPQIPENAILYAFSGFVSALEAYGPTPDKMYSPKYLFDLGHKLCQLSSEELRKMYPKQDETYLPRACGSFVYFYALWSDAYKIPYETNAVKAVKSIDSTEVSWALGRMVYEVNLRVYDRILPDQPKVFTFWVAILVLGVGLFVTLGLLLHTWGKFNDLTTQNGVKYTESNSKDPLHSRGNQDYI
jgi:hypothetical protein